MRKIPRTRGKTGRLSNWGRTTPIGGLRRATDAQMLTMAHEFAWFVAVRTAKASRVDRRNQSAWPECIQETVAQFEAEMQTGLCF